MVGVSILYQAIPLQSTLYARLQEDRVFNTLFGALFPRGCGVLHLVAFAPEEAEDVFDEAIERYPDTLGPETEARARIAAFRAELEHTRKEFPGIEFQTATLEKCSVEVQERLTSKLAHQRSDAVAWVEHLMFGDRQFAPYLRPPEEDVLSIVSQSLVREGAEVLRSLETEALFDQPGEWELWCRDNYRAWRQLYLSAAERSEELVVGVA
jgi:hypothetical protein